MADEDTNTLETGSAEPTTVESEKLPPVPSAENNYQGIDDEDGPETTDEGEAEALPEEEADEDPWKGYVDLEIDGEIVKVPEKLKDGYLRQQDYTRKTQEAANMRKEAEARAAEVEKMREVSEEELQARSAKMGIASQLKQYETVDWDQFEANDPLGAVQHFRRHQQLKDAQLQIDQFLDQAQKTRTETAEREVATRVQETTEYARKNLKGWTPELDEKLTEFAVQELNFSKDELVRAINPKVYKTLYLAHLGQQTLASQAKPAKPQPPAAPLTTIAAKAGTSGRKSMSDMSMEEYATYRKAQLNR